MDKNKIEEYWNECYRKALNQIAEEYPNIKNQINYEGKSIGANYSSRKKGVCSIHLRLGKEYEKHELNQYLENVDFEDENDIKEKLSIYIYNRSEEELESKRRYFF